MKYLVASFLLAASVGALAGEKLWGNVEYGMTVNQVKKAYPKSVRPAELPVLADGAEALLVIDNFVVDRHAFKVNFYFLRGVLTQASLNLTEKLDRHEAPLAYDSLRDILKSKYGNPISEISKDWIVGQMREVNFMSGGTNINMLFIPGDDPLLNINYQQRVAKEMDKL